MVNFVTVRSWWDWHVSYLGCKSSGARAYAQRSGGLLPSLSVILALGLTGTITNVVKICAGRPRPGTGWCLLNGCLTKLPCLVDLIDRCQPIPGSVNAPVYGLSNHTICTQTDAYILRDGFRSFPSGHSSCKLREFSSIESLDLIALSSVIQRAWLPVLLHCRKSPSV